ncbi:MAG: histidine phosphatase family protein [Deltaproteobacteria bacterium]|nr:histidine phosphatase family protein [Deltaproteobacteria bacterium]
MRLLIIRHGEIQNFSPDEKGPSLSQGGKQDLAKVRDFLKLQKVIPHRLLSSPARRALETAEILNKLWSLPVEEVSWLRPGVSVSEIEASLLRENTQTQEILALVSHQPALGYFLSNLLWQEKKPAFDLSRGSSIFLDYDPIKSQAKIHWMVSPYLLA